jgi:general secretion pathway protein G
MRQPQAGFTLIELMVVIVIIGILIAIALPNYIGSTDRARLANVKSNAHTVQLMLETYSADNRNQYPHDVADLQTEAQSAGYWKAITNPFDEAQAGLVDYTGTFSVGGAVGYDMTDPFELRYYLYCSDRQKQPITVNGQNHVLTNS